jgi:hypothetical protein
VAGEVFQGEGTDTSTHPKVVKVRLHPADVARVGSKATPPLPFEANWKPPSLLGVEKLTLRGNQLASMIGPRITRADISQTMDEPLTIQLDVWDHDRSLLRSGLLDVKLRIALDRHAFAMTRVAKNGDLLSLEFEDANVNALRAFSTTLKAQRGSTTRIDFVKQLLQEKGAPKLRWYIDAGAPGQITVEKNPLAMNGNQERKPGPLSKTTVKGQQASTEQLDNIKVVLGHLFSRGATKDELIMTSMCCTAESSWTNLTGGDRDSVGLFQQRASQGWKGLRDRTAAADEFFDRLRKNEANIAGSPISKQLLVQSVQRSGTADGSNYGRWQEESTKTVGAWDRAFGGSQSAVATSLYEFRRGGFDGSPETTWECTGRLADEVHYRRFIVEGIFYFLPDELLVGTGARLVLQEESKGMLTPIDFDMDEGVDPQTANFSIHTEEWYAPVGTCIEITETGPANGIWLVNKVGGSLLQPFYQDIELVRPRAVLTEPPDDQTLDLSTNSQADTASGRDNSGVMSGRSDPNAASTFGAAAGEIPFGFSPKDVIDQIAIPTASEAGVTKTVTQNDLDNHNPTHLGSASDHAGPPDYKWAADFGIGTDIRGNTNPLGAANGDAVAAALAARFGIPWSGAGVVSATHSGMRFQMLWRYESAQAGNHYTHVHFGVRRVA